MHTRKTTLAVLAAPSLCALALRAGAWDGGIVRDGSFEHTSRTYDGFGPLGDGWITNVPFVAVERSGRSYDGNYCLDMTAFNPGGGVTQYLSTVTGQKYAVTFYMYALSDWLNQDDLTAAFGSTSLDFGMVPPTNAWTRYTFTAAATSPLTQFSLDLRAHSYSPVELDAVSVFPVAAVPEASGAVSFGLLLTLGLGSVVVTARRKEAQRITAGIKASLPSTPGL